MTPNQELANGLWAFATLEQRHEAFLGRVAGRALRTLAEFTPQEQANTAWAIARLQLGGPRQEEGAGDVEEEEKLLDAIARSTLRGLEEFNPQDLASTSWAFAKLLGTRGGHEAYLFGGIVGRALRQGTGGLAGFNPQDLAQTAWAFATMEVRIGEGFRGALAAQALRSLEEFDPQQLANTSWALAKWGERDDSLLKAMARKAVRALPDFSAQNLANTAWSFAMLDWNPGGEFVQGISVQMGKALAEFLPQELGTAAWALARLGARDETLFRVIADEAVRAQPGPVVHQGPSRSRRHRVGCKSFCRVRGVVAAPLRSPAVQRGNQGKRTDIHIRHRSRTKTLHEGSSRSRGPPVPSFRPRSAVHRSSSSRMA